MKTYSVTQTPDPVGPDTPCFRNLMPEELKLISRSKTRVLFRRGESLTKQSAFGSSVLFVIQGIARQYIEHEHGKIFNLGLIIPGDFIGLSLAFQKSTYNYSVTALQDTLACLIEKEAVAGLIRKNGEFAYKIITRYCGEVSSLYETIGVLLGKQMPGRLADTLLYLDEEAYRSRQIFELLSRRDIAEFAGISTENTVKLLKTFEKEGIIRLSDKDVQILNREKLLEISRTG